MDSNRVEEAFDDDHCTRVRHNRSMEIEQDERLAEAGRKSILRILANNGAAAWTPR